MLPDKRQFLGIQSLRAIAALLVLFQHVTFYVTTAKGLDYLPYLQIDFGRTGVKLFFVISGFVMAYCIKERTFFLMNRAIRIYPAYWLSILFSYILLNHFNSWAFDFKSFFLIPGTDSLNNSYKVPYWTLIYEVFFYSLLYFISLWAKTAEKIAAVCCLWLLSIFIVNVYHSVPIAVPQQLILFSVANIYFISGLLFALYEELLQKNKAIIMVLFLSLALWGCTLNSPGLQSDIINAIAFGLLVYSAKNMLNHPLLVKLGDYSYGMYLLHVPILLSLIHLLQKIHPTLQLRYLWPIVFLVTLLCSVLFGKLEYQLHRYLKKVLKNIMRLHNAKEHSIVPV